MNDRAIKEKQASLSRAGDDPALPKSWGERLSLLLIMAMECCLVSAVLLVQAGLSPSVTGPLLPIWAIFLLSAGFYWVARGIKRLAHQGSSPRLYKAQVRLMMGSVTLLCLVFCLWWGFYAQHYSLFDFAWLQAFSAAFWQFDNSLQMFIVGLVICIIAWLSYQMVEGRADAALLLRKGGPLLFTLTGISMGEYLLGSNLDYWQAVLLLPIFFWSGLTSQALQKASAKRRRYAMGLEGSMRRQEQTIFQVMLLLGLIALPAVVMIVQAHGGNTLVRHASKATPDPLLSLAGSKKVTPTPISDYTQISQKPGGIPALSFHLTPGMILAIILGIIAGILLLGLICIGILFWLRQLKQHSKREKLDEIKSLWSWSLFLAQLKALLQPILSFFKRWRWKSGARGKTANAHQLQSTAPETRTIREIYRALLRRASQKGYRREPDETPYEFRSRLSDQESGIEPELGTITEAYTLARYAGAILPQEEVARIKTAWRELDHRWKPEG